MTMGEVIRQNRKKKGLTQEEMAARLGVTAPAVNKWEKGNTLPDVALLKPIARLLGISTDELLSFEETLTDGEIEGFIRKLQEELESRDFREVFAFVKETIEEYPSCESLILQAAALLDVRRMETDLPDKDEYEDMILGWYERCLLSQDEWLRTQAADPLFHACIRREEYEKAARYLKYFSLENPERKRKEALVNGKTGKRAEAYRACEELLFSGYQQLQLTLDDLRILCMEDGDRELARRLVSVSSQLAAAFEMGRYQEVCVGLDVAVWEKDVPWTAKIMRDILDSVDTLGDMAGSRLYRHMKLKTIDPAFKEGLKAELARSLEDESFAFMQGNEDWERLKRENRV